MRISLYTVAAVALASAVTAQSGTFISTGSGCPEYTPVTRAVPYMLMPVAGWSLNGRSLTFAPSGSNWLVAGAGSYIPPSPGATAITPGDDVVRGPFALPFSFVYPGGAGITGAIDVSSNGHVYLEAGTNTDTRCCNGDLPNFLSATPSFAVLGTDLNPLAGGSWTFEVRNVGPDTVALVTWRDVPEYTTVPRGNNRNTVQCQLWSTNLAVITHVHTNGGTSTHSALVGVSPGGGVADPGSMSFNPGIWLTNNVAPNIGSALTIAARQIPPGASIAALQFGSLVGNLPLSPIGAPPGCNLLVGNIFLSAPMAVTVPTAATSFTIPNNPASVGLVLHTQALVGDLTQAGTYPIPVFVSNRGTLTVGM